LGVAFFTLLALSLAANFCLTLPVIAATADHARNRGNNPSILWTI
jgi:hypothetical protein